MSDAGGWIASHRKDPTTNKNLKFCHNGLENSCFDTFCKFMRELQLEAELAHVSTFDTSWMRKMPYKEMIDNFLQKRNRN
jgi:hypothetical protein